MTTIADLSDLAAGPVPRVPLVILHLAACFEDDRQLVGHADQRDQRRALTAIGSQDPETDKLGFLRACAWAALTRTGQIAMGWAEFDRDVVQVVDAPGGVLTPVDPTPAVSEG